MEKGGGWKILGIIGWTSSPPSAAQSGGLEAQPIIPKIFSPPTFFLHPMRAVLLATLLLHGAAAVVMPRSRSNVVCRMPSLSPLPPALAASDGSHTFTYDSVQYATRARTPD